MKQVFRRVLDSKGVIAVEDVPAPLCGDNQVLVETSYTVISAGTEGATLSKTFPELVKQTLQDPWMRQAVKNLIFGANPKTVKNIVWDETTLMRAIGYSGSGVVKEVGKNVTGFNAGDRVAFAAEGHAELVAPTKNFVVPIPENVSLEEASFVTLGGIAMQGVRRTEIQLGEKIVVYGLGLVGLLVAQLVNASGGQVIGIDIDPQKLDLLQQLVPAAQCINASDLEPVSTVIELSGGLGADAVIICASSKSEEIANNAMKMNRKQGRVVFVGLVKMNLERMPFFRNELDLRFSRAYGPGVMDPDYDKGRVDYPYHYVRWTEQRNLEAFLRLIHDGKITVKPLMGGAYRLDDAQRAYDDLYTTGGAAGSVLLQYSERPDKASRSIGRILGADKERIHVGVIGCGNFTRSTHIPNLHENKKFSLAGVASKSGVNAVSVCKRFNIPQNTTDSQVILDSTDIDAVVISTRHDTHCQLACDALNKGKHVFLEKPAVLNFSQYDSLYSAIGESEKVFMLGYNRRYAGLGKELKASLHAQLPMIVHYQVSVPEIPGDHWTLDHSEGGGRLIGEAEHFFDFINFLADGAPSHVDARCLIRDSETASSQFNFSVDLQYANNVLATVTYTSLAAPDAPRERVVVHQSGRTFVMDDFRTLEISGSHKKRKKKLFSDMGHTSEIQVFAESIQKGKTQSAEDVLAASRVALLAQDALEKKLQKN